MFNSFSFNSLFPNQLPVCSQGFIISNRIILLAIIMLRSFIFHLRYFYHKKLRQTHRISYKTLEFVCLLIGATFVALFSFGFAKLADIDLNLMRIGLLNTLSPLVRLATWSCFSHLVYRQIHALCWRQRHSTSNCLHQSSL